MIKSIIVLELVRLTITCISIAQYIPITAKIVSETMPPKTVENDESPLYVNIIFCENKSNFLIPSPINDFAFESQFKTNIFDIF